MAPEFFSEEIQPRQFLPAPSRTAFLSRRQIPNPAREVFGKLSAKLRGRDLPGIAFAEKYLSHLYGRNRRPNTLEINYTSIRFFLEFLKTKEIACMEAISQNW